MRNLFYSNMKKFLEINVHVYDVTSGKYNIDDKTNVIYLKKNNSTSQYDFNDTDGFYVKPTT